MIIKYTPTTLEDILNNSRAMIAIRSATPPSFGEKTIAKYLKKRKIAFKREHWFNDCFDRKTNHLLFFDFYIPSMNMCIEFQGQYHYYPNLTPEQKAKDLIKVRYCNSRGIKLLVIHHLELNEFPSLFKSFSEKGIPKHQKKISRAGKAKRTPIRGFNMLSEERHNEIVSKKKTGGKKHRDKMFRY